MMLSNFEPLLFTCIGIIHCPHFVISKAFPLNALTLTINY